jgi:hypothetical protein
MLLGVPVFTVIYAGVRSIINGRLKDRGLPSDTETYKNLDHIDPETGVPLRRPQSEKKPPKREKPESKVSGEK